jgi:uncharacterized protein YbaR (Trm112 family)
VIDKELLEILVCPKCKKALVQRDAQTGENAQGWLVCGVCRVQYPVREGIPIMLLEEAVPSNPREV